MKRTLLSYYFLLPVTFGFLFLTGCKDESDKPQPSPQYVGTYQGTANAFYNGSQIGSQGNMFIVFAEGANSNELRITGSSLDIKQDKVSLSGNTITLPKKAILGNTTSELGNGTFNGNDLTFNYIITSYGISSNGDTIRADMKKVCNFTKVN